MPSDSPSGPTGLPTIESGETSDLNAVLDTIRLGL